MSEKKPTDSRPVTPSASGIELSPEEGSEVTAHINRKALAPNDECPVCGSLNNSVLRNLYQVDVSYGEAVLGPAYQAVYTTACLNCGFMRLFSRNIVEHAIEMHKAAEQDQPGGD